MSVQVQSFAIPAHVTLDEHGKKAKGIDLTDDMCDNVSLNRDTVRFDASLFDKVMTVCLFSHIS